MIFIEKLIKYHRDVHDLYDKTMKYKPEIIGHDTETTGLHIIHDKPFLLIIGFITNDHKKIYTYVLDLEHTNEIIIKNTFIVFKIMCKIAKTILAHNQTFDMHMERNYGYPILKEYYPKLMDTQALIRLSNDAIPERFGGVPLALKDYVVRFIDKKAKIYEHNIMHAIKENRQKLTKKLLMNLKKYGLPDEYKITGTERNWTKAIVIELTKDSIVTTDYLYEPYKSIVKEYYKEYPYTSRYDLLNREMVIQYAHKDVRYLFQIYIRDYPEIVKREQLEILKEECELIPHIYDLEKAGRYINLNYALESKKRMKKYILKLRKELIKLAGQKVTANQAKELLKIFKEKFKEDLPSTDKNIMTEWDFKNKDAKHFANLIMELRSKIKWYTTYIISWIEDAIKYEEQKIYPQYNPYGAVTGRTSSPFQQFPREGLENLLGEELYIPRKMFITPPNKKLYYFDYSAMELRFLAIYTMLLGHPDLNLCRAFIPLECHHKNDKLYLNEDPTTEWHKLDLHKATYATAYNIPYESVTKEQRYIGKRVNFGIIYGIGVEKLSKMLHISFQEAKALHDAFYKLYPNVRYYERYVNNQIQTKGYFENLFGRRYYGINGHKGKNYGIQGSCADYTKLLFTDIKEETKNTSFILEGYLHDEFSFRGNTKDEYVLPKIKKIMGMLETEIPMIADIERSDTDWSEKYDYKLS